MSDSDTQAPATPAAGMGVDAGVDSDAAEEPIHLGQRLLDSPFLLLVAGMVVMLAFYTVWGVVEVMVLTPAPLP